MAIIPEEFTVDVVGEITGTRWVGVFKAKPRLVFRDTLKRDQIRRDLLGPKPEDAGVEAAATANVFSKIWTHLVEAPSWWSGNGNGLNLEDEAPVLAVHDAIMALEKASIEKLKAKGQSAGEALQTKE